MPMYVDLPLEPSPISTGAYPYFAERIMHSPTISCRFISTAGSPAASFVITRSTASSSAKASQSCGMTFGMTSSVLHGRKAIVSTSRTPFSKPMRFGGAASLRGAFATRYSCTSLRAFDLTSSRYSMIASFTASHPMRYRPFEKMAGTPSMKHAPSSSISFLAHTLCWNALFFLGCFGPASLIVFLPYT